MKKQTAVEWLVGQLPIDVKMELGFELVEQAKQMEKEQHDNTWVDSRIEDRGEGFIGKEKTFKQYYSETYGK